MSRFFYVSAIDGRKKYIMLVRLTHKRRDLLDIGAVMSHEVDEAQEDFDREHRYAQAALQRKRIDVPAGKVMRYESVYDSSEECMCDKVWIDRLTGKEVMRYDAADPANTNSYYGARPDEESFVRRGLDFYELIAADSAKPLPQFPVYDDGRYDDDDHNM